ncbi:MAG: hypothetical protein IJM84_04520 [Bacteroidaceae bacterium]|nr:hypothetical protein [Bacteroidaceae bacterium]
MKKIFTLIAMATMALGANAQGSWVAPEEAPAAGTSIIKGDLLKVETVFETTGGKLKDEDGNEAPVTFGGKTFSTYMQVRVDADPTVANPTGTEKAGNTPLVFTAKKNVDITVYYRRQAVDGGYVENNGKDLKLVDQTAPTAPIKSASYDSYDIDGSYGNIVRVFKLEEGKTYTLFCRGTTGRLYGIDYQEGTGVDPVEPGTVEDGTYFISYNVEPALSNVTLEGWKNTGTANNVATWEGGFSIMIMRSDKGMGSGSNITIGGSKYKSIKVSNGAQNTLTLPEGKVAKGITFYSYVNNDEAGWENSYWKEVAGVTYEASTMASSKDGENPDVREFSFNGDQLNKITFTNNGKQLCYVIKVDIEKGDVITGIKNVKSEAIDLNAPAYNLAGQKVAEGYKGVVIQNGVKRIQK